MVDSVVRERKAIFDQLIREVPSLPAWEYCLLRTNEHERVPELIYFRTEGAFIMRIEQNTAAGDQTPTDAYRRAIAMLGRANWEMVSDAYLETRWLDHARRDLLFKRQLEVKDAETRATGEHF